MFGLLALSLLYISHVFVLGECAMCLTWRMEGALAPFLLPAAWPMACRYENHWLTGNRRLGKIILPDPTTMDRDCSASLLPGMLHLYMYM